MSEGRFAAREIAAFALRVGDDDLDGYAADRFQALSAKVTMRPSFPSTRRILEEMPCKLVVTLDTGEMLEATRTDDAGVHARPTAWDDVVASFDRLAAPHADAGLRAGIVAVVRGIERHAIADLAMLLGTAGRRSVDGGRGASDGRRDLGAQGTATVPDP